MIVCKGIHLPDDFAAKASIAGARRRPSPLLSRLAAETTCADEPGCRTGGAGHEAMSYHRASFPSGEGGGVCLWGGEGTVYCGDSMNSDPIFYLSRCMGARVVCNSRRTSYSNVRHRQVTSLLWEPAARLRTDTAMQKKMPFKHIPRLRQFS